MRELAEFYQHKFYFCNGCIYPERLKKLVFIRVIRVYNSCN